ncbi:MAG: hypothetical protein ABIY70_13190 [Capsulimonas sp.]|uniref:LuxE/PaaK family acyltransferase n=1 Tax=Capsulimonas sp. TaxID=2494211 RepID=UPI0032674586
METLARNIAAFIAQEPGGNDEEQFNALALELFARQYEKNEVYRRLCESLDVKPGSIDRWRLIPATPSQAFKLFDLSCTPSESAVRIFHSSGTTLREAGKHYMDADALALYEISLKRGFELGIPGARDLPIWAMMPAPDDAPHSSLSHMLGDLRAERFYWDQNAALSEDLAKLDGPIVLFGAAFAFIGLFDVSEDHWSLPEGSIVIETGGFKGRTREVAREELYQMFQDRLGVPIASCYSEYGMSEMASQFYSRGLDAVKRGPHWVRTVAIDPVTGQEAAAGQPGLLTHFDLANYNSVMAVQTEDMGVMDAGGFSLRGRATDAELRGCSLTVEELWARQ